MTVLIGLHGRRGAGKNTAFDFIHEWALERGVRAASRGFADDLKWSFARLFLSDCSRAEAVAWCEALKHDATLTLAQKIVPEAGQINMLTQEISGRVALQRHGTEGHRQVFGDDFWVDNLLPDQDWSSNFESSNPFEADMAPPHICVITDLRFENEARRIRELGGVNWYIDRPWDEDRDVHVSEQVLPRDRIDQVILNQAGLDELAREVNSTLDIWYGTVFKKQEMHADEIELMDEDTWAAGTGKEPG